MKQIIIFLLVLSTFEANSNTVYWADKLVGYSSQTGNKEYSAFQVLGKPSIMPYQGLSASAWMPKFPTDRIEWIRVKFPEKIFAEQIIINENLNPGAIVKIILYDSLNQGHLVFSNHHVRNQLREGRLSKFNIDRTAFRTDEIKIEVNVIEYYDKYQIEAIGIADYHSDYEITINTIEDSVTYEKERLSDKVNSPYSELAPIISQDGRTLVFTREGHPGNIGEKKRQDVWISRLDSTGNFSEAENLGEPVNNENANFAISISTDANSIFLGNIYLPDGTLKAGFSVSNFDGYRWSYPDSIIINDYYNLYPKSSFCLANNSKILITAIKQDDSYGKTDLHVSFLEDDSVWSKPKNLGPLINTSEEELSPYLASDNKTLYFSTSGRPGYGNCDMYVSRRLDDSWTNWTEPVNLGPQINTSGWDAYYTVTSDGQYAYFVSSHNSETAEDIYRVRLPQSAKPDIVVLIKGKVLNQKTNQPLSADIRYEILPDGKEAGMARSNPLTGEYSIILPAGNIYGFLGRSKGFASVNQNIDLKNIKQYNELRRDLYLVPIEEGQIVRINNIFFNFAESELLPESYSELYRLVDLLNQNPDMKIQLNGHTDNVGKSNFNKTLSLKRAEAVADFLQGYNISMSRIKIQGFGSTKPIDNNTTDEGRAQNRRVEFVILEK
ncbi:MAG: OmpA family protein [Candidatus Kapabacteria bacterium]|nr:OmpA family protein [Ignavibacteriota bacterium]MCW5883971.1 OmpA family protein [Candidatus Kapabacteria bacterium]